MDYRQFITIDPDVRSGQPCVRGLTITVDEVLHQIIASRMSFEEVVAKNIGLTRHHILACLKFWINSIEGGEDGSSAVAHPVSPSPRGPKIVSYSHDKPDA